MCSLGTIIWGYPSNRENLCERPLKLTKISLMLNWCKCFSTYGVSGKKWEYAAKAAVMTILSSFGGGCVGLFYTLFANKGQVLIMDLINSVLGSLVAVTGDYSLIIFLDLIKIWATVQYFV